MPQSMLAFAVSLTPETPNFETFGGVGIIEFLDCFFLVFFKCVYAHI